MSNLSQITVEQGGGPWDDVPTDALLELKSPTRGMGQIPASLLPSSSGLAAGDVTVAASGVVTAAGRDAERLSESVELNIREFGTAVGEGSDDSDAFEAAINALAATASESGGTLRLPRNKSITITRAIEIRSLANSRANFLRIAGDDIYTSKIYATHTSGNALEVYGRNVALENFTLTASAGRTAGSGNGINSFGGAAPSYFQGRVWLRNLLVTGQPGHGIYLLSPELLRIDDVDCEYNGGSGLTIDKHASAVSGIFHSTIIGFRSRFNGSYGVRLNDTPEGVNFINLEAYSNGATSQVYVSGGRNCIFTNPDVEDQASAATPDSVGITLIGSDHVILGGHFASLTKAIDMVSCVDSRIEAIYATNESASVAMAAVVAQDGSCFRNLISVKELTSAELVARNITTVNSIAVTSTVAMVRRRGGLWEASGFIGRLLPVTYAASVAFNTDNNDTFAITALTNNITIANPSGGTSRSAQRIRILLLQDGTGGRTITWGANFDASLPTASGTANQFKTIVAWYNGVTTKWSLESDSGWH